MIGFSGDGETSFSARYTLRERLGDGAKGAVYSAYDTWLARTVAIKLLHRTRDGVADFERVRHEARAAAQSNHPNVVRIYDVGLENDRAFIVMELVAGITLLELLRVRGSFPRALALQIAQQLCAALAESHRRGVIHRDLKPGNVLLEASETDSPVVRVVDFGLADLRQGDHTSPGGSGRAGSRPYQAPEQLTGYANPDASSDLYAVGCVLFEMVTGRRPFGGRSAAELELAVVNDPVPLVDTGERANDAGLNDLLSRLLSKRRQDRPASADRVREELFLLAGRHPASDTCGAPRVEPSEGQMAAAHRELFVGREHELAVVERLLRASRVAPQICVVAGPSGIGKSALLARASASFQERAEPVLVLHNRCRPARNAPFRALDGAIHDLCSLLTSGRVEADELIPARCFALCQLFPALRGVPVLDRAAGRDRPAADPARSRRQGAEALRELLTRLSSHAPVALLIDDLQWLDPDSVALLRQVLAGDAAPKILICAALTATQPEVSQDPFDLLPGERTPLRLGPLSEAESRALIALAWRGVAPRADQVANLLESCGGTPFLLSLAVDHAAMTGAEGVSDVESALLARYRDLQADLRRVVETIVLSEHPLDRTVLDRALGLSTSPDLTPALQARLLRVRNEAGGEKVEPYHSTVVAAFSNLLPKSEQRARHRALARELAGSSVEDEGALVEHTSLAGDSSEAVRIARTAALRARDELAFERAVSLYQVAIKHCRGDAALRAELELALIDAYSNAGQNRKAAELLLARAAGEGTEDASSLQRRAGELLLSSGNLREGLDVVERSLERLGMSMPPPGPASLFDALGTIQRIATRGLQGPARAEGDCAREELYRLDLCLSLAQGLTYADLRCLWFVSRALELALELGEPRRLQRACALFVASTASHLPTPLTAPVLELCRERTGSLREPYARAMLLVAESEVQHFDGKFLAAEFACEQAEHLLLESCVGAWRELADCRIRAVLIQYSQKGDYKAIFSRSQRWLEEAEARDDLFLENWLRAAHALAWVARDDPERARSELIRAEASWYGGAGVFEVAVSLYLDVIDRYLGNPDVHLRPAQARRSVLDSPASQTPFLQGYLHLHVGWGWLRKLAATGSAEEAAQARAGAEGAVARLRALGLHSWLATADALEGNLLFLDDRPDEAVTALESAESRFRQLFMLSLAACARRRRGELLRGRVGERLTADADLQLRGLGVEAPERFAAAYFSPYPPRPSDAPTLD